jgi:hypothetical protein
MIKLWLRLTGRSVRFDEAPHHIRLHYDYTVRDVRETDTHVSFDVCVAVSFVNGRETTTSPRFPRTGIRFRLTFEKGSSWNTLGNYKLDPSCAVYKLIIR